MGLPQLASRLDEETHWNRMLSLGEQQRLGLARALLHGRNICSWTRRPLRSMRPRRRRFTVSSSEIAGNYHSLDRSSQDAKPFTSANHPGPRR